MTPFADGKQPYYIYAVPGFSAANEVSIQMHVLCSLLNQAGLQAYIAASDGLDGHLWTPMLTPQLMASHLLAGKKPISVVPSHRVGKQVYPGLTVGYQSEFEHPEGGWSQPGKLSVFASAPEGIEPLVASAEVEVALPWVDSRLFCMPGGGATRHGMLVWSGSLPKLGKKVRNEHAELPDLSPFAETPMSAEARASALKEAECIFCYGTGSITTEARLCGCKVIYIPTDWQLHAAPTHSLATSETFFESIEQAIGKSGEGFGFSEAYLRHVAGVLDSLAVFSDTTQALAGALPFDQVWSDTEIDTLGDLIPSTPLVKAERADRKTYKELADGYVGWKAKTTPREIYADVAAQYISSGAIRKPEVHVYAHGRSMDELANVLDDLAGNWLQPSNICVHASHACPVDPSELGGNLEWLIDSDGAQNTQAVRRNSAQPWCVLIESGVRLEPFTLYELLKAAREPQGAVVIYAADDVGQGNGTVIPNLKGGGNVELLRHTNYLGGIIAVQQAAWMEVPNRHLFSSGYRLALTASAQIGAEALLYVDRVVSHQPATQYAGAETDEFNTAKDVITKSWPGSQVVPDEISGCWKVQYPDTPEKVTAVVPTGNQLGYLDALLKSIDRFEQSGIAEIILVTHRADESKTLDQIGGKYAHLNIKCVPGPEGDFNLGAYLNKAIQLASHPLVLVCDDDIEFLTTRTTETLARHFSDLQVAMVSPRQVLQVEQKPLLMGGPCFVGNDAALVAYNGQQQWLAERGFFNRLQMSQDVAGVQGACFMLRRDAHASVLGFDEAEMQTFCTVTDFGYKLLQKGHRIVWTPDAGIHHAGGATFRSLRKDPDTHLRLQKQLIGERDVLSKKWVKFVAELDLYSQHLSREVPYRLEPSMVIEWDTRSPDRPRVLAQPLSSGSGQYRVIEPLDAMQSANLAETALIFPDASKKRRIITATDIAKSKPDRVLLQHSIADEDISNLRNIKRQLPETFVIQLMDDLISDLPTSHPNFNYGQREGHVRTIEAISMCDRLIVSTQPLADYYSRYCSDIVVVPNSLDEKMWGHHFNPQQERKKLRIGWAGAAQHQGDLAIVTDLLRHFADRVDWIFMGMCPDALRPMVKEFHSFVSYSNYPSKLATLDLDIAIAPLEDNPFNQCKSNLRLLEYGAMGWPVVCSNVFPFRTSNPPVLTCSDSTDEWIEKLSQLVDSFPLRQKMGQQLNEWLKKNYMLKNFAATWNHAIFK